MTKEELENYEPKGKLKGFPKEIIARMLDCQEEQGNKRDISVFENIICASASFDGFSWNETKEGWDFWNEVITEKNFDLFFEKYPKKDNQDNSQEFNLENYVPKGELIGFPKEIIARMLDCQEEQGNKRYVIVFEEYKTPFLEEGGFDWDKTKEKFKFWDEVIYKRNFDLFFEKYPKKEDNQEFKVGDKVYDILLGKIGIVKEINLQEVKAFQIAVVFENYGTIFYTIDYTIEGKSSSIDKYPRLVHYRDDYDYSVIDFNNLPQRQEFKRWRAKVGEKYYYLDIYFEVHSFLEEYSNTDTKLYKIGNYFQTKEQAQKIADKLKEYFNQLINK